MAEVICTRLLAERLRCEPQEISKHGFIVRSAGVMAYPGDVASEPAQVVAQELNADLSGHRSQPVTPELLANATDVFAMTTSHLMALQHRFPGLGPPARLLCGDGDLTDPIGGELDEYRACAAAIREHLNRYLSEWLGS
jgi:protein-tyrosine-phosphatase